MQKTSKTIRVDRARWYTGAVQGALDRHESVAGSPASALYVPATKQHCCLGFACRQLHRTPLKDIAGLGLPSEVDWLDTPLSAFQVQAAAINDDRLLTSRERESQLRALFKEHGFRLVFYGSQKNAIASAVRRLAKAGR